MRIIPFEKKIVSLDSTARKIIFFIKALKRMPIVILCFLMLINLTAQDRIVSLAPSITKQLMLLELNDKVIGCTQYCPALVKTQSTVVATAVQVNLEKTLMQRPDIVLATSLTNPETKESLRNLGIKVVIYETPKDFEEICAQFSDLGKLLNKIALAEYLVKESKLKMSRIKLAIPENENPEIFFQLGINPLFAAIPGTFSHDYIVQAGGKNICSDLSQGTTSRELIIARNPDIIITMTMGEIGYEEKKVWESFTNIGATKNNKIIVMKGEEICSPTPKSFVEVTEKLINYIYN